MAEYVGKSAVKVDAEQKARGRALYAGDHYAEGMLHIAVVRSEHGHANIRGIDVSRVPAGVTVITGADIPVNIITYMADDQPVLADKKVRFFGEAVALVAADTAKQAKEAAKLVRVDYEALPAVTDAKAALAPDAPKIHEQGNLIIPFVFDRGDAEGALAASDLVVEKEFTLPTQEHIYMEPEAAFARYDENHVLEVYVSTQNVFLDKRGIVRSLGLQPDQVRVRADAVGGGFGGKAGHLVQSFPAIVTWKTGRPSKLICSRRESIAASFKRHAAQAHVRVGFTKDGRITAYASDMFLDTGAYINYGPVVLGMMSEHMPGPYRVDNVKLNNMLCYTNRAPASAMRGFGAPQAAYIMETVMNEAADRLEIDPVELRLRNAWKRGDVTCLGEELKYSVGIRECLELVRDSDLWKERETNTDPYIGYGMAAGHIGVGMGRATHDIAEIDMELTPEGIYRFYCGLTDMGQGNTTGITQIAAEYLGVPMDRVEVVMQDTGLCYECNDTVASRSAYIGGNAAINAVDNWRREGEPVGKRVHAVAEYPESTLDFKIMGLPHCMYSYMAQVAKVRVDPLTGKAQVLEVFGATEAGRIINPAAVEGQVCGGILMSMGYALTEELHYENGKPVETDMAKYIVATSLDAPKITAVTVDSEEETGPYGCKGVGEIATVAITPAIAAAVRNVCGVDVTAIPLDPEKILDAVAGKKEGAK